MTFHTKSFGKKHLAASVLALAIIGYSSVPAFAMQTTSTSYEMPTTINMAVTDSGCTNNPGPQITLSGYMGISPVSAKFTFQNNADGTHAYTSSSDTATAIPQSDAITIPKQPVDGGVGGNPYIFVQYVDGSGNALSPEIFLGRCVQGATNDAAASFSMPTTLTADVSALECSNTASDIDFTGNMVLDNAVKAEIIFTNNADGTHTNTQVINVTLFPAGTAIEFPKQPSLGGVGGNPYIYLQWLDSKENPIGDSAFLGRCVQNF